MPTRRLFARPLMPQIKTYTAGYSSPQLVQRSLWFGGFRAKHRLREQDTDDRRGKPFAKNSTGVRGRPFWADHIRMTSTRMRPSPNPDNYLYLMDSFRDRLNACDPPEDLADRQYEDIILQAFPAENDRIRQTHLERKDALPTSDV